MAPDQTHRSVARKNLDLESAMDLASGDGDQDEMNPLLAAAEKDYRMETHKEQF